LQGESYAATIQDGQACYTLKANPAVRRPPADYLYALHDDKLDLSVTPPATRR
jgi:hypothetical protein